MARIGRENTRPEMALRRALHARGYRYRLHDKRLPGTPDLAFARFRAVCFVHGCFWHRHVDCPYATNPVTRAGFWQAKFSANIERDARTKASLLQAGWRVAVIWECALRKGRAEIAATELGCWLRGTALEYETTLEWMAKHPKDER